MVYITFCNKHGILACFNICWFGGEKDWKKWCEISTFNLLLYILLSKEFVIIWSIIVALGLITRVDLAIIGMKLWEKAVLQ